MVVGQLAGERLMAALDYRLRDVAALSAVQVAVVLHALADHTALIVALTYRRDESSPWPEAQSLGRWLHDVGDQLEGWPA